MFEGIHTAIITPFRDGAIDKRHVGEDLGDVRVLKRYQRIRKWENWVILGFTDILDRTFSNQIPPIVWVRHLGLWAMEHIQPFKSFAIKLMLGMVGRVPQIATSEPIEPTLNPPEALAMAIESRH